MKKIVDPEMIVAKLKKTGFCATGLASYILCGEDVVIYHNGTSAVVPFENLVHKVNKICRGEVA